MRCVLQTFCQVQMAGLASEAQIQSMYLHSLHSCPSSRWRSCPQSGSVTGARQGAGCLFSSGRMIVLNLVIYLCLHNIALSTHISLAAIECFLNPHPHQHRWLKKNTLTRQMPLTIMVPTVPSRCLSRVTLWFLIQPLLNMNSNCVYFKAHFVQSLALYIMRICSSI